MTPVPLRARAEEESEETCHPRPFTQKGIDAQDAEQNQYVDE
jgi:hypothetical protein